ncbi:MAG: MscL family protein, partial [Pseudomonadota bacterium]
ADLINPIIGLFMGGVNFTELFYALDGGEYASLAAAEEAGAGVFAFGRFIMAVINFLIIAFVVFMLVKAVNNAKKKEEPAPAADPGPSEKDILIEIRDALAAQK